MAKFNNNYSSSNIKPQPGVGNQTDYTSKKVLGKVAAGAPRRPGEYMLENLKK